jgi:hypothetical protein
MKLPIKPEMKEEEMKEEEMKEEEMKEKDHVKKRDGRRDNNTIMVDYITYMEKSYNKCSIHMSVDESEKHKNWFLQSYNTFVISRIRDLTFSVFSKAHSEFLKQFENSSDFLEENQTSRFVGTKTFKFKRKYSERFDDPIHNEFFNEFEFVFIEHQDLFKFMEMFFQLDQTKESHLALIDPIFRAAKSYPEKNYAYYELLDIVKILTIKHKAVKTFLATPMSDIIEENKENNRLRLEKEKEKEDMRLNKLEEEEKYEKINRELKEKMDYLCYGVARKANALRTSDINAKIKSYYRLCKNRLQ